MATETHVPKRKLERRAREVASSDRSTKAEIESAARRAGIRAEASTGSTPTKADWIAAVLGEEAPESVEPGETEEPTESAESDVTEEE